MDGFQRRREQKKTHILEATSALILEYGVQKISIAEIAKEANVSQVTIYNYFESKHNLIHATFIYYVDKVWADYEQLLQKDIPFPEKIKQIIFTETEIAKQVHPDFYEHFMKEYAAGFQYIETLYEEKVLPYFMELFNQGKKEGHVDKNLSNEAILFYIQMMKDYMQREDVYQKVLPLTEDIIKILFYGIIGKSEE